MGNLFAYALVGRKRTWHNCIDLQENVGKEAYKFWPFGYCSSTALLPEIQTNARRFGAPSHGNKGFHSLYNEQCKTGVMMCVAEFVIRV